MPILALPETLPHPPPLANLSSPLVLIADATAVGRQLASFLLLRLGFRTESFASGAELLALLEARLPAFILVDLNLRNPDALELARAIRARELAGSNRVPLLAVSLQPERDTAGCRESGFDQVLPAPLEPRRLEAACARWSAIQVDELHNRVGGNPAVLRKMDAALDQSIIGWERQLDRALETGNADQLRRVSHQIKGACANLAAPAAAAAAKALEDLGEVGDLTAAPAARSRLWSELGRTRAALKAIIQ